MLKISLTRNVHDMELTLNAHFTEDNDYYGTLKITAEKMIGCCSLFL